MFWRRFAKRTSEKPEQIERERVARTALKGQIMALFNASPDSQFTIKHLEQQFGHVSLASLSLALAELQSEGAIDRIIRVESPESRGGIQDFASPDQLPSQIYDWRTQQTISVEPSITSFIFKAHATRDFEHANA
jgi:hypothetical protein